ncbi:MAG: hypothetical protein CMM01_00885 [Rhodopirellula sp.]|nr:hypothetical protein [Rhodopirellula sp.]
MNVAVVPERGNATDQRLLLSDAIGPFLRNCQEKRINWSKIPFSNLEGSDGLLPQVVDDIPGDFRTFVNATSQMGYNALTLDDVAHLIPCDHYPETLSRKITQYRELFGKLMEIATQGQMRVFFTMDVMFFNPVLDELLGEDLGKVIAWLKAGLEDLFNDFPAISGVIMRFGETDGLDVKGDFRSRLLLKKPAQARRLLEALLPVFAKHGRLLVFRTWSVAAYKIGDLNWNEKSFHQVFDSLDSPSLIISLNYRETDFFRYLPLNNLFFVSHHKKIVEFQARREIRRFWSLSIVRWDAAVYLQQLQQTEGLVGQVFGARRAVGGNAGSSHFCVILRPG